MKKKKEEEEEKRRKKKKRKKKEEEEEEEERRRSNAGLRVYILHPIWRTSSFVTSLSRTVTAEYK
jgi:hypothetical protein